MQRGTQKPPQTAKLQNEPNPKNGHLAAIAQSTQCSDPSTHTDQNRCATMRIPSPCNAHQSNYNWGKIRAPGRYHGAAACARWLPLGSRADLRTIKPYLFQETYKVLKAIDNRDCRELADEPGDLI